MTGKDVIPKLMWIKDNQPKTYRNTVKFLDVNGYLKFRATGRMAAELSGACSYGFDLKKNDWLRIFFRLAGIDTGKLADLVRSTDCVGTLTEKAARELGLPRSVSVFGGCDDTQSAAMGTGAVLDGEAHIYLGTSAWVGVTVKKDLGFKNGAATLKSADPDMNLLVGITESAGSNLEWLIDRFYAEEKKKKMDMYTLLDREASQVPAGSDGLIITPWMLGERCPVSSTTTRSTVFNLSLEHSRGHIVKAQCEGIGYNIRWIIENYERDFKLRIQELRITGGGSQNNHWMQAFADITKQTIITTSEPKMAGAIGAAAVALVGAGVYNDFTCVQRFVREARRFKPDAKNFKIYDELFDNYKDIYMDLRKTYRKANKERFAHTDT